MRGSGDSRAAPQEEASQEKSALASSLAHSLAHSLARAPPPRPRASPGNFLRTPPAPLAPPRARASPRTPQAPDLRARTPPPGLYAPEAGDDAREDPLASPCAPPSARPNIEQLKTFVFDHADVLGAAGHKTLLSIIVTQLGDDIGRVIVPGSSDQDTHVNLETLGEHFPSTLVAVYAALESHLRALNAPASRQPALAHS